MVFITDAPAVGVVGLRGVAQRIAQGSTYFKILRFPRLPAPDDVVSDTILFEIGPSPFLVLNAPVFVADND